MKLQASPSSGSGRSTHIFMQAAARAAINGHLPSTPNLQNRMPIPIFDGHNDVLLRLFNKQSPGVERLFLAGEDDGQLDFPRALKGGFAGGLFAIFVSSQ